MLKTPPGEDQRLLRRIAITARRQRCRIGSWPLRIRVQRQTWHLIAQEEYTTNAAARDLVACFTHGADHITPGAAASIQIERSQLLVQLSLDKPITPARPAERTATHVGQTTPVTTGSTNPQPVAPSH
jgi:hypothetical protein